MELPGAWSPPALSLTLHSSEQAEPQQESSLVFVLITNPEFLCCFNSEQSLQQEEGVRRGPGSHMYLLEGLLPSTAETLEVSVGQQMNRHVGKGQGRHWSNLITWWFVSVTCCCAPFWQWSKETLRQSEDVYWRVLLTCVAPKRPSWCCVQWISHLFSLAIFLAKFSTSLSPHLSFPSENLK